jgi:putative transcriptional regulator
MGKILVPKIKELREKRGLSQRRLAQALDLTENTIANWENGRTGLDWFERVAKLCEILDCSPNELFGYVKIDGSVDMAAGHADD